MNSIIGTSDLDLAKKLEPKSINGLFSMNKNNKALCPTSKSTAKKWMSFFFGGRMNEKIANVMDIDELKSESWVYNYPFQIITSPLKR